jgi:hypothetical protein
MPVEVMCPACSSRLKLGEQFLGRKLVCPKCNHLFQASAAPAPVEVRAEVVEEVWAEIAQPDSPSPRPARSARPAQPAKIAQAPRPKAKPQPEPQPVVAEVEEAPGEPRRKRRKMKRSEKSGGNRAVLIPILLGAGLIVPAIVIGILVYLVQNTEFNIEKYFYGLLVLIPINAVILFISLIIVSNVMGGVELGSIPAAIAKGVGLLIVVVPIMNLQPAGIYVAIPILLIGLMALFNMDIFEAMACNLINIGVSWVLQLTILGGLMTGAIDKVAEMPDEDESKLPAVWGLDDIERVGGKIFQGLGDNRRLRLVNLKGCKITDENIASLRRIPIQELDLSDTPITDEGLKHIRRLDVSLIKLSGTKVTKEGVDSVRLQLEGLGKDISIGWP